MTDEPTTALDVIVNVTTGTPMLLLYVEFTLAGTVATCGLLDTMATLDGDDPR